MVIQSQSKGFEVTISSVGLLWKPQLCETGPVLGVSRVVSVELPEDRGDGKGPAVGEASPAVMWKWSWPWRKPCSWVPPARGAVRAWK